MGSIYEKNAKKSRDTATLKKPRLLVNFVFLANVILKKQNIKKIPYITMCIKRRIKKFQHNKHFFIKNRCFLSVY